MEIVGPDYHCQNCDLSINAGISLIKSYDYDSNGKMVLVKEETIPREPILHPPKEWEKETEYTNEELDEEFSWVPEVEECEQYKEGVANGR